MSTIEMQIAARLRQHPGAALTNLHSFITESLLKTSFLQLKKSGAVGVDGQSWQSYNESLEENLKELHKNFKSGTYRAPHIRRTYIPKGGGKLRPLGIPTIEDKVLQKGVSQVLTAVYEKDFYDFSYGFRAGRSQHQALDVLFKEVSFKRKRYIIDADIEDYFGSINHSKLRELLDRRIKDGVIRKQIDKWLKAGILEEGQIKYPTEGTPQGGVISPLLSNVYLHYVLDEWFTEQIQPLLKGGSSIIRFADDFLLCFDDKADALRVMEVLPKRMGKYDLRLHPEKTRLIELEGEVGGGKRTFDFLGFTHYMSKSRKGNPILKRKTSRKKFSKSLQALGEWMKQSRNKPIKELIATLNQKIRGHYNYYGITFNSRKICEYREQVKRLLQRWLNRRGGRRYWTWKDVSNITERWIPLIKPKIYHSYL